eukprot:c10973_g1_i1 orf=2-256(-)
MGFCPVYTQEICDSYPFGKEAPLSLFSVDVFNDSGSLRRRHCLPSEVRLEAVPAPQPFAPNRTSLGTRCLLGTKAHVFEYYRGKQ